MGCQGRLIATGFDTANEQRDFGELTRGLAKDMKKRRLRFPFCTVWSEGRMLADQDCPSEFRKFMQNGATTLVSLQERRRTRGLEPDRMLADEALFLLCCMHADAPPEVVASLMEMFSNGSVEKLQRYHQHVAQALGACRLDWQRELLAGVISALRKENDPTDICKLCLSILGNALWRCGDALEALSNRDVTTIVERLILVLKKTHVLIETGERGWSPSLLKDHLELVLGLLRSRAADDF